MKFRDLMEKTNKFELKDLIKILNNKGYTQYKNPVPNRMHEYTNKDLIVSLGSSDGNDVDIFRIRSYDKKDGVKFLPKDLNQFTKIIKNRSLESALKDIK